MTFYTFADIPDIIVLPNDERIKMSKDELVKEFTEAVSSGLLDKDLSSMIDLLNRRQAAEIGRAHV